MGTLRAGVQYNDWTGTAAADRHDDRSLFTILVEQGKLDPNTESLVGVRLWDGENHLPPPQEPYIYALVADAATAANPKEIREVQLEMSILDFFMLFKRIEIVLADRGLEIDKDYQGLE